MIRMHKKQFDCVNLWVVYIHHRYHVLLTKNVVCCAEHLKLLDVGVDLKHHLIHQKVNCTLLSCVAFVLPGAVLLVYVDMYMFCIHSVTYIYDGDGGGG